MYLEPLLDDIVLTLNKEQRATLANEIEDSGLDFEDFRQEFNRDKRAYDVWAA